MDCKYLLSLRPGPIEHSLTTGPPVRSHRASSTPPVVPVKPPVPDSRRFYFLPHRNTARTLRPSLSHPLYEGTSEARRRSRRPPPPTTAGATLPRRTASCPPTPLSASASGLPQLPLHPPGSDPPPAVRPHFVRVGNLRAYQGRMQFIFQNECSLFSMIFRVQLNPCASYVNFIPWCF